MSVIIIPRKIGLVEIDCFLSEGHDSTLSITDNPIEDGSSVSDHAYLNPRYLTLEIRQGAETAVDTYDLLLELQALREPFDIISGLAEYFNMMIENISADRDKKTAKILSATVTLREVRIVGTESLAIRAPQRTIGGSSDVNTNDRVSPEIQRGDNQTETVPVETSTSIAASIVGL